MTRADSGNTDPPVHPIARVALLGWTGFCAFLSIDVLIRIIGVRDQLERAADGFALIAIEGSRSLALIVAFVVVGMALRAARSVRAAGLFAALVAFLAVWYARAFSFPGYPGHFQEWLAGRLIAAGTPIRLLDFVFAAPEWSIWLGLGALLRLSVIWPRPLDAASISRSGAADRRGMLRSTAVAGADIGAAFRSLAAKGVASGSYGPGRVWPAVLLAGILHSIAPSPGLQLMLDGVLFTGLALAITNTRAALGQSTRRQRRRILWVTTAAVLAGGSFLVSGTLSFGTDAGSALIGMTVASLAPTIVLLALMPTLKRSPPVAGRALRSAVLVLACAWTGSLAYLLSMATLPGAPSPELPVREAVAVITSIVLVAITIPRLRQITDRLTPPLAS